MNLTACLTVQTADAKWRPSLLDEKSKFFFKVRNPTMLSTLFTTTVQVVGKVGRCFK